MPSLLASSTAGSSASAVEVDTLYCNLLLELIVPD